MKPDSKKTKLSIIQWLFLALSYGITMGIFFSLQHNNWIKGMTVGVISGVCFATAMIWFVSKQSKRSSMNIPNFDDEDILVEGPANHVKGVEAVGGYLWLTSEQLFFRSHKVNIQNHDLSLSLFDITSVEPTKTFGIIPNGLLIRMNSEVKEKFVVNKSKDWIDTMMEARSPKTL